MMAANQSLKSNRNLLAKRKERKALGGSYAGIEIAEFPEASDQQLKQLRERLTLDRKNTRRKQLLVLAFIIVLSVTGFIFNN